MRGEEKARQALKSSVLITVSAEKIAGKNAWQGTQKKAEEDSFRCFAKVVNLGEKRMKIEESGDILQCWIAAFIPIRQKIFGFEREINIVHRQILLLNELRYVVKEIVRRPTLKPVLLKLKAVYET